MQRRGPAGHYRAAWGLARAHMPLFTVTSCMPPVESLCTLGTPRPLPPLESSGRADLTCEVAWQSKAKCMYVPSRTPPVETTTSRNKNARKISPNFRENPYKLRRVLQISTKFRNNCSIFAEFGGNLQNSAKFVGISAKHRRNVASICVSTGRCFGWWRPAWIMLRSSALFCISG